MWSSRCIANYDTKVNTVYVFEGWKSMFAQLEGLIYNFNGSFYVKEPQFVTMWNTLYDVLQLIQLQIQKIQKSWRKKKKILKLYLLTYLLYAAEPFLRS